MQEPVWITKEMALAIHSRQLSEHGGMDGTRDEGLLESALARAQNIFFYGDDRTNFPAMAAAYAYGIATNHPFIDGNKRTALVAARLFLKLNDHNLQTSREDKYDTIMKLAAGEISEEALAAWFAANTVKA